MKVYLSNRGNPDHGQDLSRPVYGTMSDFFVEVRDTEHAASVCREYIEENDLGGGNWTGGQVVQGKDMTHYVSYNGRVWDSSSPSFAAYQRQFKAATKGRRPHTFKA